MGYAAFEVEVEDGVAQVTLTGPGRGNAMGPDFWRECPGVFRALDADESVRVIVVRGSGKGFSTGLDLLAMAGELQPLLSPQAGPAERAQLASTIAHMQVGPGAPFATRKVVIAAVHGWCIGGGLDLVAAADVRVCSAGAKFSLREVKVGMVADVGSLQRLPHIIGDAATRELAFTGRDIDAARALQLGLVSQVFDDDEALFAGAQQLAREIGSGPPRMLEGIKQVMNARIEDEVARGLKTVAAYNAAFLGSEDLAEAIAAWAEKRAPVYRGR